MSAVSAVAAWTGPAALALLATEVFNGAPGAPLMTLSFIVFPLLALARGRDTQPSTPGHAALALPGLVSVLAAHAVVLADLARLDGLSRWIAPAVVLAVALAPLARPSPAAGSLVIAVGVVAVIVPVAVVGAATGATPWSAWSQIASRPALVFSDRSGWVGQGRALAAPATLTFDEPHRVTAVSAVTLRVTEADRSTPTTRERRLAGGESLELRPGDRLSIEAGARVQFERGKRVPGAAASGVAWADSIDRHGLPGAIAALGLATTVGGAALAVVPPVRRAAPLAALVAAGMPLVVAVTGACWGVYAMYAGPDLALGATSATLLHDLPGAALGASAGAPMVALVTVALLALFASTACALAHRLHATVATLTLRHSGAVARGIWIVASVAAAAAAAVSVHDASRLLVVGYGLLAATWAGPALAAAPPRATTAAAVVGAVVFAACAAAADRHGAGMVLTYPALVAAPAAWATGTALARRRGPQ